MKNIGAMRFVKGSRRSKRMPKMNSARAHSFIASVGDSLLKSVAQNQIFILQKKKIFLAVSRKLQFSAKNLF